MTIEYRTHIRGEPMPNDELDQMGSEGWKLGGVASVSPVGGTSLSTRILQEFHYHFWKEVEEE